LAAGERFRAVSHTRVRRLRSLLPRADRSILDIASLMSDEFAERTGTTVAKSSVPPRFPMIAAVGPHDGEVTSKEDLPMRTRYERDFSGNDEQSWRRDERDDPRGDRGRHDDERNRNQQRSEPRYSPEQSQVGRGYGGNERRYADQSYWDADDRHYEWGVRSPEDGSRIGRERDRYDRFANERFAGSGWGNQQRNVGGDGQPGRSPSAAYGSAGEYARRPRDAWDDQSYGRSAPGWGTGRWDSGEATSRSYGSDRSESFLGRVARGQTGKGPKGYVRSDERIHEDVCDRLSEDDEVDASDITVTVKSGEVTLEGTVVDRHSKHRAEDITDSVNGVREVTNRLRARKGLMQEIGDKLKGEDDREHRGHSGSGTRNGPAGNPSVSSSSPSRL
jgi:BON domain-containing protein